MREINTTDFGCVCPSDFEGLCENPQALVFERQRLEEEMRIAKEHLAKLRGLRVQGAWLANRISFQEMEVKKYRTLLEHVRGLIGDAPRHLAR